MRLIDADALMKKLGMAQECEKCQNRMRIFCGLSPELMEVCDQISDAPTIDPVKHGKWETKPFYGKDFEEVPNHVWCRCPFCKNKLGVFEKGNFFQFCPVCGARLDG